VPALPHGLLAHDLQLPVPEDSTAGDLLFGLGKRERALYDRIIAEKEKALLILASEVEWHRAQSGTYFGGPLQAPREPDEAELALEQMIASTTIGSPDALHLSEDEEEVLWNLRHGGLTPEVAQQALAQIQGVEELDFDFDE